MRGDQIGRKEAEMETQGWGRRGTDAGGGWGGQKDAAPRFSKTWFCHTHESKGVKVSQRSTSKLHITQKYHLSERKASRCYFASSITLACCKAKKNTQSLDTHFWPCCLQRY